MITHRSQYGEGYDCLSLDWDKEYRRPVLTFYFGDNPYVHILRSAEDIGALLPVLVEQASSAEVCDGAVKLTYVIASFDRHFVFHVAPIHDKDTEHEFIITENEALVLHAALQSYCADVLKDNLGTPGSQDEVDNQENGDA